MRNLLLILIVFIAVVTFIRAFEKPGMADIKNTPREIVEFNAENQTGKN